MVQPLLFSAPETLEVSTNDPTNRRHRYAGFENLPVKVTVRVGTTRCTVGRLASLEKGDVIPLGRPVSEPFELEADGVLLGKVKPVAGTLGVAVKLIAVAEDDDEPGR